MEVRGVRRSWEIARSKLARTFSRSLSARMRSSCLILVVNVLVIMAIQSVTSAENRFSGIKKSNWKKGKVKAKFTAKTLKRDARMPQKYPCVFNEIKNTDSKKIMGARVCMA